MRVVIVNKTLCSDMDRDPAARMGMALHDGLDWDIAKAPDPSADVNYFLPYSDYARLWPGWHETKIAAMFFHRESFGSKVDLWDETAKAVDLRIANSRKYCAILEPRGPTAWVCHPINRAMFTPRGNHPKHTPKRIGLNGYVNSNGRKGEWMAPIIKSLPVGKAIEFTAIGNGWPVTTARIGWKDVPSWYYSLDALLCTSILDAGPGGPYEALSCGCPVIIPTDVGSLDELPDTFGIWRYLRGYPHHAADVLEMALPYLGETKPKALAAAIAEHSLDNWCAGHVKAMELIA